MEDLLRRARSALRQRLESLGRAGVTHLPKLAAVVRQPAAGGQVAGAARGEPPVVPQVAAGDVSEPSWAAPPPETVGSRSADVAVGRGQRTGSAGPADAVASAGPVSPKSPTLWDAIQRGAEAAEPNVPSSDPAERRAALAAVARRVAACRRCGELVRNRTQTVFGVGDPCARLVFLGEAPGADEDRLGEPFVGRAGQLLTDIIVKGMKLRREDVYILNILKCRPPDNRTPEPVEAAACREYLDAQLAIIQPEFICCLGAVAAQCLMGVKSPVGRLRGRVIDWEGYRVVCTWHPAYLLRNPPAKQQTWDDIKLLMAAMGLAREGGPRG